jgi:hypothetical protein
MNIKQGSSVLSLGLVAMLALLAFAAVAQAEKGAIWLVDKLPITGAAAVSGEIDTVTKLLSTFGKANTPITIECKEFELTEGKLLLEGSSDGKLSYKNCETFLNKVLSASCKPLEPIVALVTDLIVLIGGETYDLFKSQFGTTLTEIAFGAECTLPNPTPVTGSLVMRDCQNEFFVDKQFHLLEEARNEATIAAGDGLSFGTKVMTIDGSVNLFLSGLLGGNPWAGHAA